MHTIFWEAIDLEAVPISMAVKTLKLTRRRTA